MSCVIGLIVHHHCTLSATSRKLLIYTQPTTLSHNLAVIVTDDRRDSYDNFTHVVIGRLIELTEEKSKRQRASRVLSARAEFLVERLTLALHYAVC